MVAGVITNLSVCWVVVRNSQARTARNLFVINLALSDISVCLVKDHSWEKIELKSERA